MKYSDSGVNIELGDDASKVLYNAAKITWENRKGRLGEVLELSDDFSGLRGVNVGGLPKGTYMNLNFDGVGTKVEVAERVQKHETVAYDLFAMVCDDAVIRGAEPVLVGTVLDVNTLGSEEDSNIDLVKQLARGYINAANEAGVAVVNGEVAEIGFRVDGFGGFNYNWSAGVMWFARKERLISGKDVRKSDKLVGLKEDGIRSNGLSLVRSIMKNKYGHYWHEKKYDETTYGDMVLMPSKIFTKPILAMTGGLDGKRRTKITGMAHITGGGIPGKLGRMLKPSGLGADIFDPFTPPDIMTLTQYEGNVHSDEAYKTWNMGQGMIISSPEPDDVVRIAGDYGIEARVIGEVTDKKRIMVKNKGFSNKEFELTFPLE